MEIRVAGLFKYQGGQESWLLLVFKSGPKEKKKKATQKNPFEEYFILQASFKSVRLSNYSPKMTTEAFSK